MYPTGTENLEQYDLGYLEPSWKANTAPAISREYAR